MGKVVYLLWHYVLFSLDSVPRPGWLVDDVAVTVTQVATGTLSVSNNISQAEFLLSGPLSFRGNGMETTFTNAPPGEYAIEYADVPYYLTPASQTETLAPGGVVRFDGVYTFPDTNQNAISDLWEKAFLGTVSTNSPPALDTDQDGMTDYAEFVAGTDPPHQTKLLQTTATRTADGSVSVEWDATVDVAIGCSDKPIHPAGNPSPTGFLQARLATT
jgi:hypothetical protein